MDDRIDIDVHLEEGDLLAAMPDEVRDGLSRSPKQLPCKYFYDERGSRLFEEITRLPEYYPTRTEQALLDRVAARIAAVTRPREVLELGSGSARKTGLLLEAARGSGALERYIPFDVSREIAERSTRRLARDYPELRFHAVVGDFERHLDRVPAGRRRLVAFLGSTIGNLPGQAGVRFLRKVGQLLGGDGWLLLGTDLVKDSDVLEAAYNDSRGVTDAFNRNILAVVNRHLDGDFDAESFEHVAFYDEAKERVEMHLRSTREQVVRLGALDLEVRFARGELMRTEVSCKYTRASVEAMLRAAGLELRHWFCDADETFALSLARRAVAPTAAERTSRSTSLAEA